jgi:hypothetical protein
MKVNAIFLLTLVLLVSCKDKDMADTSLKNNAKKLTLEGTWELISRYNYINNEVSDSFNIAEGFRQVKMYTPTKVMWSRKVPADSTELFGYGSYEVSPNNDTLTEVLDYGSAMMSIIIEEEKEFVFELQLKENSFVQIELDEDGNRVISENYIRIE